MNDKIQRVIYRIVVDTAGLKEQVAAAKAEIAALSNSDKRNADAAVRNAERVEKARRKAAEAYGTPGGFSEDPARHTTVPSSSGGGGAERNYHGQLNVIIAELQRIASATGANRGGGERGARGPDFQPLTHAQAEERYHDLVNNTMPARVQAAQRTVAAQHRVADALEHQADLTERANRLAESGSRPAPEHSVLPPRHDRVNLSHPRRPGYVSPEPGNQLRPTTYDVHRPRDRRFGRRLRPQDQTVGWLEERVYGPYYEQTDIFGQLDDEGAAYDPNAEVAPSYRSQSGRRRRRGRRNPPFDHARASAERAAEPARLAALADRQAAHEDVNRRAEIHAINEHNAVLRHNQAVVQQATVAERGFGRALSERVSERLWLNTGDNQRAPGERHWRDQLRDLQFRNRAAGEFERTDVEQAQRQETLRDRARRRLRLWYRNASRDELDPAPEPDEDDEARYNVNRRTRRSRWGGRARRLGGRLSQSGLGQTLSSGFDQFNDIRERLAGGDGEDKVGKRFRYWQAILGAILFAVAALVPVIATATAALGAMLATLTAAVGAVGVFALAAVGHIRTLSKTLKEAYESGAPLAAEFQEIGEAFGRLRSAYNAFQEATQAPVFAVFIDALNIASSLLPRFVPLVDRASQGIRGALGVLDESFKGERFESFLFFLESEGPKAIVSLTRSLKDFAAGLGELAMSFGPYIDWFLTGFAKMAEGFKNWARELASSDSFHEFMDYAKSEGPKVLDTIGDLVMLIINLGVALEPTGTMLLWLIRLLAFLADVIPMPVLQAFTLLVFSWLFLKGVVFVWNMLSAAVTKFGLALVGANRAAIAARVGFAALSGVVLAVAAVITVLELLDEKQRTAAEAADRHRAAVHALADELAANGGEVSQAFRTEKAKELRDTVVQGPGFWDRWAMGELGGETTIMAQSDKAGIDQEKLVEGYIGDEASRKEVEKEWSAYIERLRKATEKTPYGSKWEGMQKELGEQERAFKAYKDGAASEDEAAQAGARFAKATGQSTAALSAQERALRQNQATLIRYMENESAAEKRVAAAIDARMAKRTADEALSDAITRRARLQQDVPLANQRALAAVRDAETSLAEAQRRSREAQLSVTEARIRAADQLQDLQNKLRDIALDEEGASIALARAEQNMRKVMSDPMSTSLDRREALLAYQRAQRSKEDATTEGGRLRRDAPKTEREIQESVAAAERAAIDSRRAVQKAELDLKDAKLAQTRAYEDGEKALKTANQDVADLTTKAGEAATNLDKVASAASTTAAGVDALAAARERLNAAWSKELSHQPLDDIAGRLQTNLIYMAAWKIYSENPGMTLEAALARARQSLMADPVPNRGTPGQKKPTFAAAGGPVRGPGTGTSDDVPLWASDGEHVWTAAEVRAAGGHSSVKRIRNAALAGQFDPGSLYAGFGVTPRVGVPSIAGAASVRSVTSTSSHAGFNVGDVTINNPVKEQAGESLYRAVRRLSFEYS